MKSKIDKLIKLIGKRPHSAAEIRAKTGLKNVSATLYDIWIDRGIRVFSSYKLIGGVKVKRWSL